MTILLVIHILIALALIVLVFIQYGRGGDMGAGMGGGSANSVFGASGSADFISKMTGVMGIIFFVSALGIGAAYKNAESQGSNSRSIMQDYMPKVPAAPVVPKSSSIPVDHAPSANASVKEAPVESMNSKASSQTNEEQEKIVPQGAKAVTSSEGKQHPESDRKAK